MGIIIWLVIGGIVGWLASLIMRTDAQQGILLNIVVGIVGAFLGGLIFNRGNINSAPLNVTASWSRWSARSSCSRSSTCSGAAACAEPPPAVAREGPSRRGGPFSLQRLAPAGDHPVDEQDQHRADDRGEEARAFAGAVPAELLAEEAGEHRAGNADHDRDQAAARVAARRDRLGDQRRRAGR